MSNQCRHLIIILGDQLDHEHPALRSADPAQDAIVMVEALDEGSHVASHKHRTTVFLSAMRHYAQHCREQNWTVRYHELSAERQQIIDGIAATLDEYPCQSLWAVEPGEWRLKQALADFAAERDIALRWFDDDHFLCDADTFRAWAKDRKQLTMEYFYRAERKRHDILMDGDDPVGGAWNFDKDNRKSFPAKGPGMLPEPPRFAVDDITEAVIADVNTAFPDAPGSTDNFFWPVTREQALEALNRFIEERFVGYGRYQDAMWSGEPFLYHALISSALNLKLLNPREVVEAAVVAYERNPDAAPLAAVEGFVRQIIGWREFIRGVYWLKMPGYKSLNHFDHQHALPEWFWDAKTDMNCLRQSIGDTLQNGYAHHIQRLMVIGNYATLAGLLPQAVCDWYLGIYVDAVEWVELPNTLGMALHGDGGVVGSKPYVASGAYINRMSNYCKGCQYDVKERAGDNACPFNTLYWDFMHRHRKALSGSPRMNMVLKNLDRWEPEHLDAINQRASALRGD